MPKFFFNNLFLHIGSLGIRLLVSVLAEMNRIPVIYVIFLNKTDNTITAGNYKLGIIITALFSQ